MAAEPTLDQASAPDEPDASVVQRIEELRALIRHHNDLYHGQDAPEIPDVEYDLLVRNLQELESANPELAAEDSPSLAVGSAPSSTFAPVTHVLPMMSLDNAFDRGELDAWALRIVGGLDLAPEVPQPEPAAEDAEDAERSEDAEDGAEAEPPPGVDVGSIEVGYTCELKIDGVACSLRYEGGSLVQAATRGNGRVGEDITANVRGIDVIPQELPSGAPAVVEVRGEIYLPVSTFDALNEAQEAAGLQIYSNPRITAAGSLRTTDPPITASRGLAFSS
ncbi:MAG: NAD-dependent DNA ligase LigA, partial [Actinomycetota bacterium]